MRKLLSANFSRLFKSKAFWLCAGAMLVYAVVFMLNKGRTAMADAEHSSYALDDYLFNFGISIGLFCALLSSLFIGTEYSDGTMRNKVIAGRTRADIYLANLITVFFATIIITAVWMLGALVGIPFVGLWQSGVAALLGQMLIAAAFIAAFSAIFTMLSMLSSNKTVTAVASMQIFLGLLIIASMLYNALCEPELISGVMMTENGMQLTEPSPNPAYVSGTARAVYEFVLDFLPTGQGLKMAQREIGSPARMLASSAFITAAATIGGVLAFKKKDLK